MTILVLFEQFLRKVCLLTLSASPNMMHFVRTVSIIGYVLKATKAHCYKEVRNNGKVLFIQNIVENSWWGNAYAAYLTSPPGCILTKDDLKF